jgi:hypothetical protein
VAFSNIDFAGCACWDLQHRCSLTPAETCQQNDPPVRKLKRVVMTVPQIRVDLAETGYVVTKRARKDKPRFAPYVVLKGKLGARKQANSYLRLIYRGKPARDRVGKTRGY